MRKICLFSKLTIGLAVILLFSALPPFQVVPVSAAVQTRAEYIDEVITDYENTHGKLPKPNISDDFQLPFADVESNPYLDSIKKAYDMGIISGSSDSGFSPKQPITDKQKELISGRIFRYNQNGKRHFSMSFSHPYTGDGLTPEDMIPNEIAEFFRLPENRGINIEYDFVPQDVYYEKTQLRIAAGDLSDVIEMSDGYIPAYGVETFAFANLGEILPEKVQEDLDPAISKLYNAERFWYLPMTFRPSVIVYRKNLMDQYGFPEDVFDTWEGILALGQYIRTEYPESNSPFFMYTANAYMHVIQNNGIQALRELPNGEYATDIGSPKFEALLKTYADTRAMKDDKLTNFATQPEIFATVAFSDYCKLLPLMDTVKRDEPEQSFKIYPLPGSGKESMLIQSNGYAVANSSREKELAAEMLAYIRLNTPYEADFNDYYILPTSLSQQAKILKITDETWPAEVLSRKDGFYSAASNDRYAYRTLASIVQEAFLRVYGGEDSSAVSNNAREEAMEIARNVR